MNAQLSQTLELLKNPPSDPNLNFPNPKNDGKQAPSSTCHRNLLPGLY
jgi:hypothetical protein